MKWWLSFHNIAIKVYAHKATVGVFLVKRFKHDLVLGRGYCGYTSTLGQDGLSGVWLLCVTVI